MKAIFTGSSAKDKTPSKEPTTDSRNETSKRPKKTSRDARAKTPTPLPEVSPRPSKVIQNGYTPSPVDVRLKDDGGWRRSNISDPEKDSDKRVGLVTARILDSKRNAYYSISILYQKP